jgi:hypothetical protein
MSAEEEQRIASWKRECFAALGFGETAIVALLQWNTDPHDAESLLMRDGERTSCTHAQALRILQPDEIPSEPALIGGTTLIGQAR